MSQASMFIIVNSLVREIFSIITPILHILTFLSYFANFYNSWNLSHLVALVKIWVRWNEKKVGKYEKILSCIDRSNICKSGEPRLRVVLIQLFLHLGIKKKKRRNMRGHCAYAIFSCSCSFALFSRREWITFYCMQAVFSLSC